jgi:AcrR family transcriptional regulator
MTEPTLQEKRAAALPSLRIVPSQKRGWDTVEKILDGSRKALKELGRDRFNTGRVAQLSGLSIGIVYRYFRDDVAILDVIFPDRDQNLPEEVMAA